MEEIRIKFFSKKLEKKLNLFQIEKMLDRLDMEEMVD